MAYSAQITRIYGNGSRLTITLAVVAIVRSTGLKLVIVALSHRYRYQTIKAFK
jgi:hypothetical protein